MKIDLIKQLPIYIFLKSNWLLTFLFVFLSSGSDIDRNFEIDYDVIAVSQFAGHNIISPGFVDNREDEDLFNKQIFFFNHSFNKNTRDTFTKYLCANQHIPFNKQIDVTFFNRPPPFMNPYMI